MKIIRIFTFIIGLNVHIICCYAQITITEINKKIKTEYTKPPIYDSLKDYTWSYSRDGENDSFLEVLHNKQYIGLTVYCPPLKVINPTGLRPTGVPVFINKNLTLITPNDRYYTIIGHISRDSLLHLFYKSNYYYKINEWHSGGAFLLKDNINGDTIYDIEGDWILVPYFLKQKQMFSGRTFIVELGNSDYVNDKEHYFVWDLITNNKIHFKNGTKWQCEVSVLDYKKAISTDSFINYDEWEMPFKIGYIFKNDSQTFVLFKKDDSYVGDQNITIVPYNSIERSDWVYSGYSFRFVLEDVYIENEKKRKLSEQERENLKQIQKQKIKNQVENRLKICVEKYGQYNGKLIAEGKIVLGMNIEMCQMAWGDPIRTHKTTVKDGIYEIQYFLGGCALYFINGILVQIDE